MSFPMRITKVSLRRGQSRSGGGKDYHLVLITSANADKALLIKRWAKRNQWGSMEVLVGTSKDMTREYNAKLNEKRASYTETLLSTQKEVTNEAEFKEALGAQYFGKMSPEHLKFLSEEIDTTGCREQKPVFFQKGKDGKWHALEEPRLVEEKPEPVETRVEENPTWGMF